MPLSVVQGVEKLISLEAYARQGRRQVKQWLSYPEVHNFLRGMGYFSGGFCLSAASLGGYCQSFAVGLVCACSGWTAALAAAGGALGYLLFWGSAGTQAVVWLGFSVLIVLLLTGWWDPGQTPFLLPATAALLVAATGLAFQMAGGDGAPIVIYLLRVGMAFGATWLFSRVLAGRNPLLEWFAGGVVALALAQIAPFHWLDLGVAFAAGVTVVGAFPAAALAGLGLDLAGITRAPMTAVMACGYLVRFLPKPGKWTTRVFPTLVYLLVMYLSGVWDPWPVPALLLGGVAAGWLPGREKPTLRKGETGSTQVRLELASGVLEQSRQILLETEILPIDGDLLVRKAAERACAGCPCRGNCKDSRRIRLLSGNLLHQPLLSQEELPVICRKNGRFLAELHRSQEQLRAICADRNRQNEYRQAVLQQYGFMSDFLQGLADQLGRKGEYREDQFTPEIRVFGNRKKEENGDVAIRFPGTMGRYYVLLCDGMGSGPGAVQEGKRACDMLRRLLRSGYPAEHALQSLNSLCALRGRAGAVTVDLLEMELDSGKATLFKWGAAPSYLVDATETKKVGTAGPPPGLSVQHREERYRLSLRRGETLVMVSDGVEEEEALRCCRPGCVRSAGELATRLLTAGQLEGQDDATVVTIRLRTCASTT